MEIELLISVVIVFIFVIYIITHETDKNIEIINNVDRSEMTAYFIRNTQLLSYNFPPSKCIDGNKLTFCHSDKRHHPMIEIDLCYERIIDKIRLINRVDCCKSNLSPFILRVLDNNRTTTYIDNRKDVKDYYDFILNKIKGRYIQVEVNKETLEVLHFADILIEEIK
jgi:hypothetical protein